MAKLHDLPESMMATLKPLFEALPLDRAMPELCPERPADSQLLQLVDELLAEPALANRPELAAGLWLYVDDLDRSHRISQSIESATGSYWHAIMHRREGDFSNSLYWLRNAGLHPAMNDVDDYEPAEFVRQVERASTDEETLLDRQRAEWAALFVWCATHA